MSSEFIKSLFPQMEKAGSDPAFIDTLESGTMGRPQGQVKPQAAGILISELLSEIHKTSMQSP